MTEINENERGVDSGSYIDDGINDCIDGDVNDAVNTDAGDDINDGINTDAGDGIDNDIDTDADIDDGIDGDAGGGGIDTDAGNDDDGGINTDVNVDADNDSIGGGDDGINNDTDGINTDAVDVNDVDTQTQTDEDEDSVDETRILEALLFASDELLTPSKLKAILPGSPDSRRIRKMVGEVNERLLTEGHPFEIVEAAGGYQFRTLAAYHPYVRKLYKERAAKKLSLQALECLAIIAYRQPISKAEVEAIRGVLSDGAMKTLLERKLIDLCGRSDKPGRPMLYGTTGDFLRYFGINKIGDLPRIEEFEQMARARMEEMSAEELSGEKEIEAEESAVEAGSAADESAVGGPVPADAETPAEASEL